MVEQTALIRSVEPRGRGSREEIRALEPCKQLFRARTMDVFVVGFDEISLFDMLFLHSGAGKPQKRIPPIVNLAVYHSVQQGVQHFTDRSAAQTERL